MSVRECACCLQKAESTNLFVSEHDCFDFHLCVIFLNQVKKSCCIETLIRRVRLLTQRTGLQISHPAVFPKGFDHKPEHNSL